ncbi:hypothetical protein PEP31012_03141 [Pandoraea eparura]|uniref:Uncharacterized protein n=1 Tax=Pandoraea eparura TaxID=2508291 RepID=A0A5E4WB44_9BURK|nr:hypothetical protein PEP31012_03141 [Pandoraea eparura]
MALLHALPHVRNLGAVPGATAFSATALALATRLRLTALARATTAVARLTGFARCTRLTRVVVAAACATSTTGPSALLRLANRLRHGMRIRIEARDHFALDGALDETFDLREQLMLVHAHERHRLAVCASASRAADAVHIVFRHFRQVEVDHMGQLVDVDAACGDIGRDQHLQRATLEFGECARAGTLTLVAVNGERRNAALRELLGQSVRTVLGAREHKYLEPVVLAHEVFEQFALAIAVDRVDLLRDGLGGRVATRHFDQRGRLEQAVGQLLDLVGERGREQQVLALRRQRRQHPADIANEAHVEHAVGFVEHEDLDG